MKDRELSSVQQVGHLSIPSQGDKLVPSLPSPSALTQLLATSLHVVDTSSSTPKTLAQTPDHLVTASPSSLRDTPSHPPPSDSYFAHVHSKDEESQDVVSALSSPYLPVQHVPQYSTSAPASALGSHFPQREGHRSSVSVLKGSDMTKCNSGSSALPHLFVKSLLSWNKPLHQQEPPLNVDIVKEYGICPAFEKEYELGIVLGKGATAIVFQAHRKIDDAVVAVKLILKDRIPVSTWKRDRKIGMVPIEIFVLKRLDHPNIIGFIDFFEDMKFFYLIMESHGSCAWSHEYASVMDPPPEETVSLSHSAPQSPHSSPRLMRRSPATTHALPFRNLTLPTIPKHIKSRRSSMDLFEYLETKKKKGMSKHVAVYIFKQLVSAMEYLHSHNIVHGDIKEENIVVTPDYQVKLIDFGGAVLMNTLSKPYVSYHHYHGTIHYAPPEVLRGESYYPIFAELWSMGVLLHIMVYGGLPFLNAEEAMQGMRAIDPKMCLAEDPIEKLIQMLLKVVPEDRISASAMSDYLYHHFPSTQLDGASITQLP